MLTPALQGSGLLPKHHAQARGPRPCPRRRLLVQAAATNGSTPGGKNILMLGGTRFIGVYLARQLVEAGHSVTLLTRGKKPVTFQIPDDTDASFQAYQGAVQHIAADRGDHEGLQKAVAGRGFQVLYDMNGREAADAAPLLDALPDLEQYIFCSSAGVYLKSDEMPHREEDAGDPKSRHKGKLDTEKLLSERTSSWTSLRPVYIYGPLNYNPVEEWFFQRVAAKRPIPVPGSGQQVTQLGHVKDLANAFVKVLGNPKARNQVYNVSGERYVTFSGLALACAEAMGAPPPALVPFDAKQYDFGGKKPFPLRDQHFFTSIDKAERDLDWRPHFSLLDGLRDSYEKDFGRGTQRKQPDFTTDDLILEKQGQGLVAA